VDRTHPLIRALLHSGCEHEKLLERIIQLIEQTVPIASMLQEPARSLDGTVAADAPEDIAAFAAMVAHAEQFLIRAGVPPADARLQVLCAEPFVWFRDAIVSFIDQPKAKKR